MAIVDQLDYLWVKFSCGGSEGGEVRGGCGSSEGGVVRVVVEVVRVVVEVVRVV